MIMYLYIFVISGNTFWSPLRKLLLLWTNMHFTNLKKFVFYLNKYGLKIKPNMLLMQFSTAWNVWFQVLLYGGKVVSWKNERKEQLLFMSSKVNKHCSVPFSLPKSMVVFLWWCFCVHDAFHFSKPMHCTNVIILIRYVCLGDTI